MSNTQTTTTIKTDDILQTIQEYSTTNERPCPKTFLSEKFGKGVLDMLDSLKESGIIRGQRGRNGGFLVGSAATKVVETPIVEVTPVITNDVPTDSDASNGDFERVTNILAGNEPMDVAFLRSVDPSLADSLDESAASI
jgi:hypothetical protein